MNSNNFPILLLSNYRTGSSSLAGILGRTHNLKVFSEPHTDPTELSELEEYIQNGWANYIIKFMPDQLDDIPIYNHIYNSNCYKIKLTRNDRIAQITSYYIASMTNRWNNYRYDKLDPYYTDINNLLIDRAIKKIVSVDLLLDKFEFSKHMVYEDIDFKNSSMDKLLPPANYDQLYSYIEKYYNSKMLQKSHIIT